MKSIIYKWSLLGVLSLLLVALAVAQARRVSLILDGVEISKNGRVIDGVLYAPVVDLAKVFEVKVTYKPGSAVATLGSRNKETRFTTEGTLGDWVVGKRAHLNFSLETSATEGATLIRGEIRNSNSQSYNMCFKSVTLFTKDGKRLVLGDNNVMNANDEASGGSYLVQLANDETAEFVMKFPGENLSVDRIVAVVTTANSLFEETFRLKAPIAE
jgi:hypothetical protein